MQGRPDAMGMRHAASELRVRADRVGAVVARLEARVPSMVFAGPAADRFRGQIAAEQARLREVMRILDEAADALMRGAAAVEADPTGFYGGGA